MTGFTISKGSKHFSLLKKFSVALGPTQAPMQWVRGFCPKRQMIRVVTFATHPHLVLNLRMSGAIPLFRLYAFMAWTETTFVFLSV